MRRDLFLCSINERLGALLRHADPTDRAGVDLTPFSIDDYLSELYEYALANAEEFQRATKRPAKEDLPF